MDQPDEFLDKSSDHFKNVLALAVVDIVSMVLGISPCADADEGDIMGVLI